MSSLSTQVANIQSLLNAPSITIAERDSLTFTIGSVIYNSDELVLEIYDGEKWLLVLGTRQASGGSAANTPLYDFTGARFTNGGQTGRTGPSLSQAISGITGNDSWKNNTQYFNVSAGIQLWTVPQTGNYRITVAGAKGGNSNNWGRSGGFGATMSGTFSLNKGDVLKLLVGQMGTNDTYDGGGGGGSFVTKQDNSSLIIAAGGGGGSACGFSGSGSSAGRTDQSGSSTSWGSGGSNGNGGNGSTAGGGGGLTGNGTGSWGGQSFVNGGIGGPNASGGFGGGGGGGGTNGAGGGGGYSGGGYAPWCYDGGGGGSFNNGTSQNNTTGNNSSHGYIDIQKQ
jgi:tripartite motif-containing protein 56